MFSCKTNKQQSRTNCNEILRQQAWKLAHLPHVGGILQQHVVQAPLMNMCIAQLFLDLIIHANYDLDFYIILFTILHKCFAVVNSWILKLSDIDNFNMHYLISLMYCKMQRTNLYFSYTPIKINDYETFSHPFGE